MLKYFHAFNFELNIDSNRFFKVFSFITERDEKVPFSMAMKNVKLMYECSPQHLCIGTVRMKEY